MEAYLLYAIYAVLAFAVMTLLLAWFKTIRAAAGVGRGWMLLIIGLPVPGIPLFLAFHTEAARPPVLWFLLPALLFLALWPLGFAYDQLALESYKRAVESEPDKSYVYHRVGRQMLELGRYDEAIKYFAQAAELAPRDPFYLKQLADAQYAAGDYAECIATLERAREFAPDDWYVPWGIGRSLENQGRYAEAAQAYKEACAMQARLQGEADRCAAADALRDRLGDASGARGPQNAQAAD